MFLTVYSTGLDRGGFADFLLVRPGARSPDRPGQLQPLPQQCVQVRVSGGGAGAGGIDVRSPRRMRVWSSTRNGRSIRVEM